MINLDIQIKLILFSLFFGFFFSILLEIFNKKIKKYKTYIKILLSCFLVFFMSFVYFIGIQKIGNAILHIYSILSIIIGFLLYDLIIKLIDKNNKKWYNLLMVVIWLKVKFREELNQDL